jgi:alpha-1,6-mannosyltransferase
VRGVVVDELLDNDSGDHNNHQRGAPDDDPADDPPANDVDPAGRHIVHHVDHGRGRDVVDHQGVPAGVDHLVDQHDVTDIDTAVDVVEAEELAAQVAPAAVTTMPTPPPESWLSAHRYGVLTALLTVMTVYFTQKHRWGTGFDVWEHAAAVRELARHPLHPHHPQLAIDAPHQFFSPYTLALALFSRATGIGVIGTLSLAAVANLQLLLFAMKRFCDRITPRRHVAFWTVLFTLLLWGSGPWFFSGFLHANVFWIALPYPATFVFSVVLLTFTAFLRYLRTDDWRWLVAITASTTCVMLTHPADAPFLVVGFLALLWSTNPPGQRRPYVVAVVAVAGGAFALAALWPYFDVRSLLFGRGNARFRTATSAGDHDMYVAFYNRAVLALAGVPFVVGRLVKSRGRDVVGLLFAGALAIYVFGWRTERWSFGRVVVYCVLFLHIALADARAAAAESGAKAGPLAQPLVWWMQVTTIAALAFAGTFMRNGLVQATPLATMLPERIVHDDGNLAPTSRMAFIAHWAGDGAVVMADPLHGWPLPAFGAKTVTTIHPLAFVASADERVEDVARFFDPATAPDARHRLVRKYDVRFVMLTVGTRSGDAITAVAVGAMGTVVYRDPLYTLVALPPGG